MREEQLIWLSVIVVTGIVLLTIAINALRK